MLKKCWKWLRSPNKMAVGVIVLLSALGGILLWAGINQGLEYTNTEQFCSSCHMNDVVPEYRQTVHHLNRSGVKATCSSCHLPHEFGAKWLRKIQAVKEVYAHMTGKIDTKEKFEAHRLAMAEREWARMKANNSQECRNCHNFDDMDFTEHKTVAQKMHAKALEQSKTYIDCHKGIAHNLPHMQQIQKGFIPDDIARPKPKN